MTQVTFKLNCYILGDHQCHDKVFVIALIWLVSDSPIDLILLSEKTVYVSVGVSLNITAIVTAYPKPSVQWKKISDTSIILDSHITDLEEDEFLISGTVKQVNPKHYGIYECLVDNGIGNSLKAKFDVKLEGKYSCQYN